LWPLRRKAILQHYHRGSVLGKDYPEPIKGAENDLVEGLIFYPRNMDDRKKLNNFEGEEYSMEFVKVMFESGEQVKAATYIWSGEKDQVTGANWDFKEVELNRLPDWLDLFDEIEFTQR
jgi:hypothetical protein